MSTNTKASFTWLAIAVAAVAVAGGTYWLAQSTADESEQRTVLKEYGVLTTMAGDGKRIGAVNFSTMKDKDNFHKAYETVLSLRAVSSLHLDGMPIENADLQHLDQLASLASLSLKECGLDDEGLASIADLTRLEALHLSHSEVTDEGLASITSLKKLTTIDLSDTQVCCDLSPLAKLPNLKWLMLAQCKLQPGALESLKSAPALTRVTVTDTEYDAADAEELKAALPNLSLDD